MTQTEEIELANKYDFEPIPDPDRGYGWCKFRRNNQCIWEAVVELSYAGQRVGWVLADLVDNHYVNHRRFSKLEEAFKDAHEQEI